MNKQNSKLELQSGVYKKTITPIRYIICLCHWISTFLKCPPPATPPQGYHERFFNVSLM